MSRRLVGLFFLSGFASLVLETLWFDQASLVLGSSVWATSLVLSAFMCGLAIGGGLVARRGDRLDRPVRLYAAAEATVAVSGVALVWLAPRFGPAVASLLGPLAEVPWALSAGRLVVAFLLLLVPATAMGTTLPLLAAAAGRLDPLFGRVLGKLYGVNTLGALTGAIVTETVLLERLGVRASALCAGGVAAGVAVFASALSRRAAPAPSAAVSVPEATAPVPPAGPTPGAWLAAAFLSGLSLLALEVVWFRFLLLFSSADSASFAFMLASVLAGIALGGLAGAALSARAAEPQRFAAPVSLAAGALCLASYALFRPAAPAPLTDPGELGRVVRMAVPLALPTSLLSGVLFTVLGAGLRARLRSEAGAAGAVSLANLLGAALGPLLGGFVLIPGLGVENALFALALPYAAIALLVRAPAPRWSVAAGAVALLVAGLSFPFGAMTERHLVEPLRRWTSPATTGRIVVREGRSETALLVERRALGQRESFALLTHSFSMSGTDYASRRYMKLYVYLPVAVHPHLRRALLVCYGVGSTAKALTDTKSLRAIDVVDTSREILGLSRVVFPRRQDPLRDPRVDVHVEDGRWFLMATRRRYDLITAEPPPPDVAGVSHLYSREFFQLLRSRLAPGGLVTYWLPMHGLSDRSARAILAAFCGAFDDCSLWHGAGPNLMMLGTRSARGPVDESHFARQWADPAVAPEMTSLGVERPEQLGALFVGDRRFLAGVTKGISPIVDDDPKAIRAPETSPGATDRLARSWLPDDGAARRFEHAEIVHRLFPERLRQASRSYFPAQRVIDAELLGIPTRAPRPWVALHEILTGPALRFPVILLLGSSPDRQRLAASVPPEHAAAPIVQLERGIGALADRRWPDAARALEAAQRDPRLRDRALSLRLYVLLVSGRNDEARAAAKSASAWAAGRHWDDLRGWLGETFGMDPFED